MLQGRLLGGAAYLLAHSSNLVSFAARSQNQSHPTKTSREHHKCPKSKADFCASTEERASPGPSYPFLLPSNQSHVSAANFHGQHPPKCSVDMNPPVFHVQRVQPIEVNRLRRLAPPKVRPPRAPPRPMDSAKPGGGAAPLGGSAALQVHLWHWPGGWLLPKEVVRFLFVCCC